MSNQADTAGRDSMTTTGSADTLRDRLLAMADYMAGDNQPHGGVPETVETNGPFWVDTIAMLREAASALVPAETEREAQWPFVKFYRQLKVNSPEDALAAIIGLQQRVRFTEDYEALQLALSSSPVQPDPVTPSSVATGAGVCGTCEHLMSLHPRGRCVVKDCRCVDGCRPPKSPAPLPDAAPSPWLAMPVEVDTTKVPFDSKPVLLIGTFTGLSGAEGIYIGSWFQGYSDRGWWTVSALPFQPRLWTHLPPLPSSAASGEEPTP